MNNTEKGFDKSLSTTYDELTSASYYSMFFDSIFHYLSPLETQDKGHLDIGCGNGKLCQEFIKKGVKKTVGLDVSEDQINIAKASYNDSRYTFEVVNAYKPFDLKTEFGIVTCIYTLHFVKNYQELLTACQNIINHTKKGGVAVVLEITHDYIYNKNQMQQLKELTMYEYVPNIKEGQKPKPWQTVEGYVHTENEKLQVDHIAIHGNNLIKALKEVGFESVQRKDFVHENKFYTDLWGKNGFNHFLLFCK